MFERFTDQARRVVVRGQEEARLRGDREVGTEHMLLGLVDAGESDGARTLGMLQISPQDVRAQIEEIAGRGGPPQALNGPMPLTPHARNVIERSSREAVRLGHNDIGTEDILLAMVREKEGLAARVLVNLGADLSRVRQTVTELSSSAPQRERARARAEVTAAGDDAVGGQDVSVPVPVLLDGEPDALGAAPTFRAERGKRRRRRPIVTRQKSASTGDEVVYVFEAGRYTMPELRPYVESVWERRAFIVELSKAEIRGRRSSTLLGSIWGVVDPMFQAAIYLFLFFVIRGSAGGSSSRPIAFLPALLGGMFLFRLTAGALNEGGRSILRSQDLMLTSNFPRAILPLAAIYKGLVRFVPTFFVFILVYAFFGAPVHATLLLLPFMFVILTLTNIGLAFLVSTAAVFVRDIEASLSYMARIILFTTPIIYPMWLLPPVLVTILAFNPVFAVFGVFQQIISAAPVDITLLFVSILWAIVLPLLGARLFLRNEHAMAARL